MEPEYLKTNLLFDNQGHRATATVTNPRRFVRNDVVLFPSGRQLLVVGVQGEQLEFLRIGEKRYRKFGGSAYRKWNARENRVDMWGEPYGPYVPPPAHRAKALLRVRLIWPSFGFAAGCPVIPISTAYPEGA